jgi:hypothetical protein
MSQKRAEADTLRLSFFAIIQGKGADTMNRAYFRLIAAGIRPDCAAETVEEYQRRNDPDGLERYINDIECRTEASDR